MPFLPEPGATSVDAIAGLLRRSWDFRLRDSVACNRLAAVAVAIARKTGSRAEFALALGHLGNSERLLGNFRAAGHHLEAATGLSVEDRSVTSLLWEFRASLYLDVRDFESAAVVALRAQVLRRGDDVGLCRATTLLGLAFGYGGDPIGAVRELRMAVTLAGDRDALVIAIQPMLRFLLEAGRPDEALAAAQQGRPLVASAPKLLRWRWDWHEALIHLHLGAPAAAAVTLGALHYAYLHEGLMQEAAYVALDLAMALFRDGRTEEMRGTLKGIETIFQALGIEDRSQAARALACIDASEDPEGSIRRAVGALLESQAHPGLVSPAA